MSINYNDYNISPEYVDFIIGDDKIPSYQALAYLDSSRAILPAKKWK